MHVLVIVELLWPRMGGHGRLFLKGVDSQCGLIHLAAEIQISFRPIQTRQVYNLGQGANPAHVARNQPRISTQNFGRVKLFLVLWACSRWSEGCKWNLENTERLEPSRESQTGWKAWKDSLVAPGFLGGASENASVLSSQGQLRRATSWDSTND